jgi:putative membrane protein
VLVVLAAFAGGLVVGALGMLPGWWKHRAAAAAQQPSAPQQTQATAGLAVATAPAPAPSISATDLPAVRQHGL